MGIFSGLFRSRDKPTDSTVGSRYAFYMGGSTSGKMVTERSAMQMTAVYVCVRILSEAIAGLPLHMYRYKDDGGKEKALYHPLYLLLHDEPNSKYSLLSMIIGIDTTQLPYCSPSLGDMPLFVSVIIATLILPSTISTVWKRMQIAHPNNSL